MGSGGRFYQAAEQFGDPRRRMDEVLADGGVVGGGDAAAQDGDDLIIDLILAEVAERLDDGSADPPGRGHVARGGVLKDDFPFPDLHLAGRAVGQEDDAGWHLVGESEHIGGVGPGWLDADGVPGDKGTGNRVGGWGDRAENRVVHGKVIEATGELADGSCSLEAAQAGVSRRRAAEIPEMLRSECPTLSVAVNPAAYLRINGFLSFLSQWIDGKSRLFLRQIKKEVGSFQSGYLRFAPVVVRILLVPSVRTLP